MNILNNVVPMDNQTFPFVSCFSSWVLSLSKSKGTMDQQKKKHQNLYRVYMPVTGCGVSALWNENDPTKDTCYCTGESNYLDWAMQYAGYEYDNIVNDNKNQPMLIQAIKESIESGQPVMAQGLIGTSWCLITGYDDDMKTLYGWHQREWGISGDRADGYLENGMFMKYNWYDTISRIVICREKKKREKLSASDIISHLISVMEKEETCGCIVGGPAFEKCIEVLADDSLYHEIKEQKLLQIYKSVFFFCASFAEARVFTGSTIETSAFKKKINANSPIQFLLNQASIPCRSSHKIVWDIWATLGKDYNYEPEKYSNRLKDPNVRKRMIELVTQLKENDKAILKCFRQCLLYE